jgi:ABC-type glycerol-3-phosphate transport system substrate-binding protein
MIPQEVFDLYFQNLLDTPGHFGNYLGSIYGTPWILGLSSVLYNTALYEEAGGDPELGPQKWDDYIEYGTAITGDEHIAFAMTGTGGGIEFLYWPWIWAQGGDFVNADWTAATVDSPEVVDTFQFIRDIICVHEITNDVPGSAWGEMTDLFTGEKAMMIHGAGGQVGLIRGQFPELWDRFGITMIPGQEEGQRSSFIGGETVAIASQSEYKDESLDLLIWMTTSDEAMTICGEVGWVPGCPSGLDLPIYKQDPKTAAVNAKFLVALENGYPAANHPKFDEVMSPMQQAFANLALCEKSVNEIVAETHEEIDKILKR